jgi:hypothetical protein
VVCSGRPRQRARSERGINLKAIAQIAGHTSIRTTAMYVEANPTRLARILQDVTWWPAPYPMA